MSLPASIDPMLPRASATLPPRSAEWAFEVKFDGFRALLFCEPDGVRVQSRNQRDMTAWYPELQGLRGRCAILDGEIVASDAEGRPDLELMQLRAGFTSPRSPVRSRAELVAISYQIFDLLHLDDRSLLRRPYRERRALLESLELKGSHWLTPSNHVGSDAAKLLQASRAAGLEGLVAKRLESRYEPGDRSGAWLKIKNWQRQEFVIGGWRHDRDGTDGWLGALMLGCHDDEGFTYCGSVEAGFRPDTVSALVALLPTLERGTSPFHNRPAKKGEHFVEPVLVAEVQFIGWSHGGAIRHASFKGFVFDKQPGDVRRELP